MCKRYRLAIWGIPFFIGTNLAVSKGHDRWKRKTDRATWKRTHSFYFRSDRWKAKTPPSLFLLAFIAFAIPAEQTDFVLVKDVEAWLRFGSPRCFSFSFFFSRIQTSCGRATVIRATLGNACSPGTAGPVTVVTVNRYWAAAVGGFLVRPVGFFVHNRSNNDVRGLCLLTLVRWARPAQ